MASTRFDAPIELKTNNTIPQPKSGYVMLNASNTGSIYVKKGSEAARLIPETEVVSVFVNNEDHKIAPFLQPDATKPLAFADSNDIEIIAGDTDARLQLSFNTKKHKKCMETYAEAAQDYEFYTNEQLSELQTGESIVVKQAGIASSSTTVVFRNENNQNTLLSFSGAYELNIHCIKRSTTSCLIYINLNSNKFFMQAEETFILSATASITKHFTKTYKEQFGYSYI